MTRRPAWLPSAPDTTPNTAMILATFAWTAAASPCPPAAGRRELRLALLCPDATVREEVVRRDPVLIAGHGRAVSHRP